MRSAGRLHLEVSYPCSLFFFSSRKLNLLSFGEEAEEEEKELADVKIRIKSSHDVLDDPRLLKEETQKNDMVSSDSFAQMHATLLQ